LNFSPRFLAGRDTFFQWSSSRILVMAFPASLLHERNMKIGPEHLFQNILMTGIATLEISGQHRQRQEGKDKESQKHAIPVVLIRPKKTADASIQIQLRHVSPPPGA
jgi:hypothetical protein